MRDHTVWKPDPAEISDRLGFLTAAEQSLEDAPGLTAFAAEIAGEGLTDVVLMGMGGSSLTASVLHAALGTANGGLTLHVPDTTDPEELLALESRLDFDRTLFIAASKSGSTIETSAQLASLYFWEKAPDGSHFAAITDADSPLTPSHESAASAASSTAIPRLAGATRPSLRSAWSPLPSSAPTWASSRCAPRRCSTPAAAPFPPRTPASSRGRARRSRPRRARQAHARPPQGAQRARRLDRTDTRRVPRQGGEGHRPHRRRALASSEVYGDDRIFVALGEHDGLDAIEAAGHPVVRLPYADPTQLPAEFARWEIATAVAGHVLGVHPFDQPNVQEAKDATARVLAAPAPPPQTPPVAEVLALLRPGDYLALSPLSPPHC